MIGFCKTPREYEGISDWHKDCSKYDGIMSQSKEAVGQSMKLYDVEKCDDKVPFGMFDYFIDGMK